MVAPVLPFITVSSDATQQVVNNEGQPTVNLLYFEAAVDSANRIFVRLPNTYVGGQPQYKWFVLNNTVENYPTGTIQEINCSFTYSNLDCVMSLIVLTDTGVFVLNGTTTQASSGATTYVWFNITPSGDIPELPNPY